MLSPIPARAPWLTVLAVVLAACDAEDPPTSWSGGLDGFVWPDAGAWSWPDTGPRRTFDTGAWWPGHDGRADAGTGGCAATCPGGCCDSAGQCMSGDTDHECGSGGAACVACTSPESCEEGACVMGQNTLYEIKLKSAKVPADKTFCGYGELSYCDLYVILEVGGKSTQSTVKKDSYNPTWNELMLTATASAIKKSFNVEVRDKDIMGTYSPVAECSPHVSDADLKAGTHTSTCDCGVSVTWAFSAP